MTPPIKSEAVLLRIGLFISSNGYSWSFVEWKGRSTLNSYIVELKEKNFDFTKKRRVGKKDLLIPTSAIVNNQRHISFRIWCLPEQKEEAKILLREKVISIAEEIKEDSLKMISNLELLKNEM